jgi:DNA end-binding protein Ku
MLWPDEIRSSEFANLGDVGHATERELSMATMLVESLAGDYDPDDYEDDYKDAVETLVQTKLAGGEVATPAPAAKDTSGEVVDLLAALQRSVDRAKASRGEPVDAPTNGGGAATAAPAKTSAATTAAKAAAKTATKAATKKTTGKKTAATKTATTKTAAKRSTAKKSAAKPDPATAPAQAAS